MRLIIGKTSCCFLCNERQWQAVTILHHQQLYVPSWQVTVIDIIQIQLLYPPLLSPNSQLGPGVGILHGKSEPSPPSPHFENKGQQVPKLKTLHLHVFNLLAMRITCNSPNDSSKGNRIWFSNAKHISPMPSKFLTGVDSITSRAGKYFSILTFRWHTWLELQMWFLQPNSNHEG